MRFTIELHEDVSTLADLRDAVADVYLGAYSLPPYFEVPEDIVLLKRNWPSLTGKPGFRLVTATDTASRQIVGFAYGWPATAGDHLHAILSACVPAWTRNALELADFAILPSHQGKGVGREVYSLFFKDVAQERAILKTHASDSVAVRMYESRGWVKLLSPFIWGPKKLPYIAMGLDRLPR
jgi:GNAT superfamily N-acetyltransferase